MTNTSPKIKVVQCWDDGVVDDIRLIEILRSHGARASFNLNSAKHGAQRSGSWRFNDVKDVQQLSKAELTSVYDGFTIANHTANHPFLTKVAPEQAAAEIRDGKDALEQIFGVPVAGFAYPYGDYDNAVSEAVGAAGHIYARTCVHVADAFPPEDPLKFHSNCHFLAEDFWRRFEHVKVAGGVFYFWGHSYELVTEEDWAGFSRKIAQLSTDPAVEWTDLPALFGR